MPRDSSSSKDTNVFHLQPFIILRERLRKRVEDEKMKGSEMKKKEDEDKGKQNDRSTRQFVFMFNQLLGFNIRLNLLYQEDFISHEVYEDSSREWDCYSNKSEIFIIMYGDLIDFSFSFKQLFYYVGG